MVTLQGCSICSQNDISRSQINNTLGWRSRTQMHMCMYIQKKETGFHPSRIPCSHIEGENIRYKTGIAVSSAMKSLRISGSMFGICTS